MAKLENRNTKLVKTLANNAAGVKDFKDLQTWKLARNLRQLVYRLSQSFPADERFGLSSQMRRAATSVTANIAEGFGRYSYQENIQFCRLARGSAYELRDHLTTACDQGYLSVAESEDADLQAQRVIQILNGYIRSTRVRQVVAAKSKN